ncbi:unnamed protein product, partial [Hapterophycus canaliculatus]
CLFRRAAHGFVTAGRFTDADKAMASVIADVYPLDLHRYCIWHTLQSIIKKCKGALSGAFPDMLNCFRKAAYCATTQVITLAYGCFIVEFQRRRHVAWSRYRLKRKKWALCFNPSALTLGVTSTGRVEGMNAVLK